MNYANFSRNIFQRHHQINQFRPRKRRPPAQHGADGGKKTMYRKGTLMQSVRKFEESNKRIVVDSDLDYAGIHNDGGTITVTKAMKAHFWKLYYALTGATKKTKRGKA
ncbi:MAG: hypothetical protein LBL13_08210 [Bacteroidales bacterium]|nr:hypothetical protein [Bacteroidales bacterium]